MWKQRQRLYNTSSKSAWDRDFYYSEVYPPNLIIKWVDTDTPENAQYEKDILYKFNEYGFRSDSFESRSDINILTCGCSMTVGVGVNQHENWTNQLKFKLEKHTGKSVTAWNLATAGASPDYVARSIWKVDHLLQPDIVFVYWPPKSRLELPYNLNPGKIVQTSANDEMFPKFLVDHEYLQYLFIKNVLFLREYFHNNRADFYDNPVVGIPSDINVIDNNIFKINTGARDGMHPGPDWHERVAEYYFQKAINNSL